VSHQCHIHNTQHGNGDVADDVGYGQVQDLPIQSSEILTEDNEINNQFAFDFICESRIFSFTPILQHHVC
jgi:hypothetical protein